MHKVRIKLTVDREPRPVSGPRSIILSDGMRRVNLQTGTDKSNARRAAAVGCSGVVNGPAAPAAVE